MTPQEFVRKWRIAAHNERQGSQSHFIDLCQLLNVPTPTDADPTGTQYTFEKGVAKAGKGTDFADVWKRNTFAWEYKKKHANLTKAYEQLLRYRAGFARPAPPAPPLLPPTIYLQTDKVTTQPVIVIPPVQDRDNPVFIHLCPFAGQTEPVGIIHPRLIQQSETNFSRQ